MPGEFHLTAGDVLIRLRNSINFEEEQLALLEADIARRRELGMPYELLEASLRKRLELINQQEEYIQRMRLMGN